MVDLYVKYITQGRVFSLFLSSVSPVMFSSIVILLACYLLAENVMKVLGSL